MRGRATSLAIMSRGYKIAGCTFLAPRGILHAFLLPKVPTGLVFLSADGLGIQEGASPKSKTPTRRVLVTWNVFLPGTDILPYACSFLLQVLRRYATTPNLRPWCSRRPFEMAKSGPIPFLLIALLAPFVTGNLLRFDGQVNRGESYLMPIEYVSATTIKVKSRI